MSNDSNWCPEIYRSIFVDRHNDDQIQIAPCCQADRKLEPVNGFNFHKSPYLQKLRNEFNQGKKPQECKRCWEIEELGQKSRRQSAIEFFDLPTESREVVLESIDHSATWACNLACIMCSEAISSTWAVELDIGREHLRKLGRLFQRKNNFLDQLEVENIKKIHFNGGEPMLNDDQSDLLERLDQQGVLKDVFISYNTNGTVMPSDRVADYWSRSKLVKLFFSIDATEQAFEYIRYPGCWADTEKNMLAMKKDLPGNVMFGFNVTVGAYNILDLLPVYNWFQENLLTNREGDPGDFCWQFAYDYDPAWLLQEIKHQAIEELYKVGEYQGIVSYLKNHINYVGTNGWTQSLDKIDQRRSTNWRQSLRIGKYY